MSDESESKPTSSNQEWLERIQPCAEHFTNASSEGVCVLMADDPKDKAAAVVVVMVRCPDPTASAAVFRAAISNTVNILAVVREHNTAPLIRDERGHILYQTFARAQC